MRFISLLCLLFLLCFYGAPLCAMEQPKKLSWFKQDRLNMRLCRAAGEGDCPALIQVLATPGIDVNVAHWPGNSALYVAAACWHPEACQLLLMNGAQVDVRNRDNETPLCRALSESSYCYGWNQRDTIMTLMDAGASIDEQTLGDNCRHPRLIAALYLRFAEAIYDGKEDIVKECIEKGVNLNWPLPEVHRSHQERFFLKNIYPLQLAAKKRHAHIVMLLLDRGANLYYANKSKSGVSYTTPIARLLLSHVPKYLIHRYLQHITIPFLLCCKRAKKGEGVSAMGLLPREIQKLICVYAVSSYALEQQLYRASVVTQMPKSGNRCVPFQQVLYDQVLTCRFDPYTLKENYGAEWQMQIANYLNGR